MSGCQKERVRRHPHQHQGGVCRPPQSRMRIEGGYLLVRVVEAVQVAKEEEASRSKASSY